MLGPPRNYCVRNAFCCLFVQILAKFTALTPYCKIIFNQCMAKSNQIWYSLTNCRWSQNILFTMIKITKNVIIFFQGIRLHNNKRINNNPKLKGVPILYNNNNRQQIIPHNNLPWDTPHNRNNLLWGTPHKISNLPWDTPHINNLPWVIPLNNSILNLVRKLTT